MAKVKLRKPFMLIGEQVTELEINEDLTAGILLAGDGKKGDMAKAFEVLSQACNVPVSKLKGIHPADMNEAQMVLQSILTGTYGCDEDEIEELAERMEAGEDVPHVVPRIGEM